MKSQALVLDYRRIIFVAVMSLLLSIFLIPVHYSSAAEYQGSDNTNTVKLLIDELKARIKELETKVSTMVKIPLPTVTITDISTDYLSPIVNAKFNNLKGVTSINILVKDSKGQIVYEDKNKNTVMYTDWSYNVKTKLEDGATYTLIINKGETELASKKFTINTKKATLANYRAFDVDGKDLENIKNLNRKDAMAKCLKNVLADRTKNVYCVWNGLSIYNSDPRTLYGTYATSSTPNLPPVVAAPVYESESIDLNYKITSITPHRKPTIQGKATNFENATIVIENDEDEVVYTKDGIYKMTNETWRHNVSQDLNIGVYTAILEVNDKEVAKKEFKVTERGTPQPQATTTTELGEYKGYYSDGNNFIITKSISRTDAIVNCAKNSASNPAKKVYCTWNGKVIYGTKPLSTTNTTTNTDSASAASQTNSEVDDTPTPTPAPTPIPTPTPSTVKPPTTVKPPIKPPSYYYEGGRGGDIRGASTTNREQLLATILIGIIQLLGSRQ